MNVKDFFFSLVSKTLPNNTVIGFGKIKMMALGKNDNKILKSLKRPDYYLNRWKVSEVAKRNRSRSLQIPWLDNICYVLLQY